MISVFYGTRPEYIKLYKLYSSLKKEGINVELVQVCQHTDLLKDCFFDRVIEILENKNNRLNSILVNCLGDDVFHKNTTHVVVQGDTATTFGICLNAFNRKISVIHVEAGLRTWDKENPFPEESYRKAVSSMTDVHFCVTEMNANSLKNEGITKCVYVVGNTVLDNLDKTNIQYGNVVPITLHRRENRDKIEKFLSVINDQAKNLPDLSFCYIRHPAIKLTNHFQNIQVLESQPYEKMIDMLKSSRFVITDSGGIQEEGSFFQKKIIVCRETTERPEGLNVFAYKYNNLENLAYLINKFSVDFVVDAPCPYGDGKAIEKIIKHLKEMYGQKLYSGV
jgi:UDP-N-acetylglucosamine 2-epimerase (non-hydrolysing)